MEVSIPGSIEGCVVSLKKDYPNNDDICIFTVQK